MTRTSIGPGASPRAYFAFALARAPATSVASNPPGTKMRMSARAGGSPGFPSWILTAVAAASAG